VSLRLRRNNLDGNFDINFGRLGDLGKICWHVSYFVLASRMKFTLLTAWSIFYSEIVDVGENKLTGELPKDILDLNSASKSIREQ
jgi:hypothetical protein